MDIRIALLSFKILHTSKIWCSANYKLGRNDNFNKNQSKCNNSCPLRSAYDIHVYIC